MMHALNFQTLTQRHDMHYFEIQQGMFHAAFIMLAYVYRLPTK